MSRSYPYTAWVVQPSGRIKQVELVGLGYKPWDKSQPEWDATESGKQYCLDELHATSGKAIEQGLFAVEAFQEKLTKQQASLDRRRATLMQAQEADA